MNFDQVMALVNAGFTKEDIQAMQGGQPEPAQPEPTQPAAQPDSTPAQPEPTQPAAQPDSTPAQPEPTQTAPAQAAAPEAGSQAGGDDAYQRLEAKLNQLIGLQTQANINANVGAAQPARSATDILGSVIAPPRKDKTK